jgi:hypothetical protein
VYMLFIYVLLFLPEANNSQTTNALFRVLYLAYRVTVMLISSVKQDRRTKFSNRILN